MAIPVSDTLAIIRVTITTRYSVFCVVFWKIKNVRLKSISVKTVRVLCIARNLWWRTLSYEMVYFVRLKHFNAPSTPKALGGNRYFYDFVRFRTWNHIWQDVFEWKTVVLLCFKRNWYCFCAPCFFGTTRRGETSIKKRSNIYSKNISKLKNLRIKFVQMIFNIRTKNKKFIY